MEHLALGIGGNPVEDQHICGPDFIGFQSKINFLIIERELDPSHTFPMCPSLRENVRCFTKTSTPLGDQQYLRPFRCFGAL